jgi:leucyl-tRNA synthetase
MQRYNPKEIESKWQQTWEEQGIYHVTEDPARQKSYVTAMFPYPSGAGLHVGHVRNYSITDAIARYQRQQGKNVLSTIGWDAFGLPAENYAIKTGTPPAVSTAQNIANFKSQLQRLGMSYDWTREINTTDPSYYKWTQWIFTKLFERDLAYQDESLQWWCPVCKTVLANEQVINGGFCWRHEDTRVEKRWTKQWFFRITAYADHLLDSIDDLEWPEKIKAMQRNWIGRSVGAEIDFKVDGSDAVVKVFTTRPDTLFGATFMVLAPEHPLVMEIATEEQRSAVETYIKATQAKSDIERQETDREKTGVFSGAYAINPANGAKIPIWIADYVLLGYGTGAIMAVPAHDERDHAFAQKFDIPIVRVVKNDAPDDAYTHDEGVMVNSGEFDGQSSSDARENIVKSLAASGVAQEKTNYKMRDWLVSRQRYWGAPIPIIHCPKDGAVAVPESDLPVLLPEVENYEPSGDGKGVLGRATDWVKTTCPKCGGPAERETDTMDGYACSSWYYLRYTDAHNDKQAWDPAKANYWLPIDYYCGGDHAVSHLLYSRFWMRVFADMGLIADSRKEPVHRLVYNGYINAADGTKMSKSKGNVVDPVDLIDQGYGADALRLYELFIAPYELDAAWDPTGIAGTYRFLNRVWTLTQEYQENQQVSTADNEVTYSVHRTVRRVTEDLERLSFNTAIAALMELVNDLYKFKLSGMKSDAWQHAITTLLQLTAPFAPHITEELWHQLGQETSIHLSAWPTWDESLLVTNTMTIVVQVNGKVRANIKLSADSDEATVVAAAKSEPKVTGYLTDKDIKKTVYIPGRLVNFVI